MSDEQERRARLRAEPLDLESLLEETAEPECGALVVFAGTVRNENRGRPVERLSYEAHGELAEKTLARLEDEVVERFDVRECRLQHRTGTLAVGEPSVLVVVRAPHRAQAFEAGRWAIDELKERVPLWKEEHYADGESEYLEGTPLRRESRADPAADREDDRERSSGAAPAPPGE